MSSLSTQPPQPVVVHGLAGMLELRGTRLGPSHPVRIDQSRVDAFAEATDDHQWIHVDRERSATGPFGQTIAHGYLTLSLCSHFLETLLDVRGVRMAVNYGTDRVRFPSPVPVGSELVAAAEIVSVEDIGRATQSKIRLTLTIPGAPKPACVADVLVRHYA